MDKLLGELAALRETSTSGSDGESTSRVGRLVSEIGTSSTTAPAEQGLPPQLGQEEQEQMLTFLMSLEAMRLSDPVAFEKTMEQLLPGLGGAGSQQQQQSKQGKQEQQEDALKQLITSLKGAVASPSPSESDAAGIKLPGAGKSVPKGITITPTPGYVIKTRQTSEGGSKVFINVCSHENIDPPGMKKRLNENGEEVEGMNIPLSVGAGRGCKDKAGAACKVYDIIVNPKVIEEGVQDGSGKYRDFVAQLCIQSVEQKYSMPLDRRYTLPVLKNNYQGDEVESQMIQDRKSMPKIEEVAPDSTAAKAAAAARLKKQAHDAKLVREAMAAQEVPLKGRLTWVRGGNVDAAAEAGPEDSVSASEHVDPILVPAADVTDLGFFADVVAAAAIDASEVVVKLSPFKLSIKVPGHKALSMYLPCAVLPCGARCSLSRKEGFTKLLQLRVVAAVDRSPWDEQPDAGSKQWLMANALRGSDEDAYNPYDSSSAPAGLADAPGDSAAAERNSEVLPEDRFHVKMPSDVDPYTGIKMGGGADSNAGGGRELEEAELPEDRFHKKDAASQYIIQQREQAVKDKWSKHEKEKAERVNDPNVEYVDMDDFKPGGKLGPPLSASAAASALPGSSAELKKAAEVVMSLAPTDTAGLDLSSTTWAELCD